MAQLLKRIVFGILLCTAFVRAHAVPIIDTGPGASGTSGGFTLSSLQWLAGEFSLSNNYVVTDVRGWVGTTFATGLNAAASIYSDGGASPGVALRSAPFALGASEGPDWFGASGLSWNFGPGTYWVVLSVLDATSLGFMPSPVPSPLPNYAFSIDQGANWLDGPGGPLGFQIHGNVAAAIPEASTYSLMLLGLAVVGFSVRRKKPAN